MKNLALLLFILSCASNSKLEMNYQYLLKEQILAHKGLKPNFDLTTRDLAEFRSQLVKIIKRHYYSNFTMSEFKMIEMALHTKRKKTLDDIGSPVFQNFHGKWSGEWTQENTKLKFNHLWFPPKRTKGIIVQKVIINESTAAINTYDPNTGLILGAVGNKKNYPSMTHAPHLGFYVNPQTLIWIARFSDSKVPYYSFYYEQIKLHADSPLYTIRGIGFNWNREKKLIDKHHWKEGLYKKI